VSTTSVTDRPNPADDQYPLAASAEVLANSQTRPLFHEYSEPPETVGSAAPFSASSLRSMQHSTIDGLTTNASMIPQHGSYFGKPAAAALTRDVSSASGHFADVQSLGSGVSPPSQHGRTDGGRREEGHAVGHPTSSEHSAPTSMATPPLHDARYKESSPVEQRSSMRTPPLHADHSTPTAGHDTAQPSMDTGSRPTSPILPPPTSASGKPRPAATGDDNTSRWDADFSP